MSLVVRLFTVTRTTMREGELGLFRLFDIPQPRASYGLVQGTQGEVERGLLHAKVDLGYRGEH